MIGLLQRVTCARVEVDEVTVVAIGRGLLVMVAVEHGDDAARADRLLERILGYRVFADKEGRMNLSLADTHGGLLLVPQFTLAADTRKGARPSFAPAAPADLSAALYDHLTARARERHAFVQTGQFGANMQIHLVNDGPVTFWLRVAPGEQ
ncbi:MAG: D-tyrosyl-tRNA(Tyr) deacylase [Gammaproteobacteria bacterium]|nr:D-tyrosyl-tRNA(Tyr) deacylase [Gammaproteobacteria bacterium]